MLPPQLQQNAARALIPSSALVSRTPRLLRPTVFHLSSRSFWRHRCIDWTSPTEPAYQRFHRIRTLKTRAKLLEKIRRRGRFEWDANQRPFFTPKHIRWASHWNDGPGRNRWFMPERNKEDARAEKAEQQGYELTDRERKWQEQLDKMRKRIEEDPYAAIFGKRFEPFWSPLEPRWMREETGPRENPPRNANPESAAEYVAEKQSASSKEKFEQTSTEKSTTQVEEGFRQKSTTPQPVVEEQLSADKPSTYSYASSTSWNSWSNKTTKVEWDSVSKKTKQYEYDPVSNRMVEVEPPTTGQLLASDGAAASDPSTTTEDPMANLAETLTAEASLDQPADARKAISIPTFNLVDDLPYDLKPATSLTHARSTAISSSPAKPAALAILPERDLDLLTADDVRASMGKTKSTTASVPPLSAQEKAVLEEDFDLMSHSRDAEVDAILKERGMAKGATQVRSESEWDQAETAYMLDQELATLEKKKEKLLKDERGLFHIERQTRELSKLNDRIKEATKQAEQIDLSHSKGHPTNFNSARQHGQEDAQVAQPLQPALDRPQSKHRSRMRERDHGPLQSSLDRLQSKDLPLSTDPDDSAAHESTEPIPSPNIPKDWTEQADLLQADRVRRTAGVKPPPLPRWIDDMESRKAKYEAERAELDEANGVLTAEDRTKWARAKAMLENEVAEQKLRLQAFETRHAHRAHDMTREIDATATSTVNVDHKFISEEHRRLTAESNGALAEQQSAELDVPTSPSGADHNTDSAAFDVLPSLERTIKALSRRAQAMKKHQQRQHQDAAFRLRGRIARIVPANPPSEGPSVSSVEHVQRLERELEAERTVAVERQAALETQQNAYRDKIRSLRDELEIAYKQSTVHSEKHLERIRELEQQLAGSQKSKLYKDKIRSLRDELEIAYKQSSVHSEMHLERIRDLEQQLVESRENEANNEKVHDLRESSALSSDEQGTFQSDKQTESLPILDQQPAETRQNEAYQSKIRDLREELDNTFKQSAVNSDKHLERIRNLEKQLTKQQLNESLKEDGYKERIRALRDQLNAFFKQSTVRSEKHNERVRDLEQQLTEAQDTIAGAEERIEHAEKQSIDASRETESLKAEHASEIAELKAENVIKARDQATISGEEARDQETKSDYEAKRADKESRAALMRMWSRQIRMLQSKKFVYISRPFAPSAQQKREIESLNNKIKYIEEKIVRSLDEGHPMPKEQTLAEKYTERLQALLHQKRALFAGPSPMSASRKRQLLQLNSGIASTEVKLARARRAEDRMLAELNDSPAFGEQKADYVPEVHTGEVVPETQTVDLAPEIQEADPVPEKQKANPLPAIQIVDSVSEEQNVAPTPISEEEATVLPSEEELALQGWTLELRNLKDKKCRVLSSPRPPTLGEKRNLDIWNLKIKMLNNKITQSKATLPETLAAEPVSEQQKALQLSTFRLHGLLLRKGQGHDASVPSPERIRLERVWHYEIEKAKRKIAALQPAFEELRELGSQKNTRNHAARGPTVSAAYNGFSKIDNDLRGEGDISPNVGAFGMGPKSHRSPNLPKQVVEVESDVDLGEELARYEQENAQQSERQRTKDKSHYAGQQHRVHTARNPIDGTQASPATGNFANPTGFVNHDSVGSPTRPFVWDAQNETSVDPSSRRIRRQEEHFTGTRTAHEPADDVEPPIERSTTKRDLADPGVLATPRNEGSEHANASHRQHNWRRHRAGARRRRIFRRALQLGVGAAGVVYIVGVAAERSRNARRSDYE